MWAGVSYCALLLLSSATAQGASANYQDSTSATQEGLCSKGFKGWRLLQNGLWIGADCCQAACSLEASSNPQGTIYYFLHRREVLSCWRRGERRRFFILIKCWCLVPVLLCGLRVRVTVLDTALLCRMYKWILVMREGDSLVFKLLCLGL